MDCYGTDRNQCTVGINGDFPVYSPTYSLNASFDGNGPIRVQWYRNRDKFDCSLSKVCTGIISKPNYQVSILIVVFNETHTHCHSRQIYNSAIVYDTVLMTMY